MDIPQRIGEVSCAVRLRMEIDAGSLSVLATGGSGGRFLELTDIGPGLVPPLLGGAELARIAGVSVSVDASCGSYSVTPPITSLTSAMRCHHQR
jgi:hypothetical protein